MSPVRFIRFSCWYSEVSIIARYPRVDSRPDTGIQFLYVKQVYSRRLEPRMMHNTAWVVRTPMSIYLLCHIHSNCYANIKRESPTNKAYSRDFIQMQIKKFRHDHANSQAQLKNARSFRRIRVVPSQCLAYPKTENCAVCFATTDRSIKRPLDRQIALTFYKLACPLSGTDFCSRDRIHLQAQPRYVWFVKMQ